MTKKTFNQWRYDTVAIGGSGDVYQFTSEAYVSVYLGWGVSEAANASNNRVIVDGTIVGDPSYGGIESLGNRFALDIGQSGIVMGGIGVSSAGAKAQIDNLGYIIASTDYGVIASGNGFSLHNGGLIEGVGGVDVSGDNVTLVNAAGGLIKSNGRGIFIESASGYDTKTINHGVIMGAAGQYGYDVGESNDTLVNTGRISGSVEMEGGDDVIDNRGGQIAGSLTGGAGDDQFITDDDTYFYGDIGRDGVKSTASYVLTNTVEWLQLLGKANIAGTGNDGNNRLTGNSGNNALSGLVGADRLDGRQGNDRLLGGDDADTFVFATGYGRDRIRDFTAADTIDVSRWQAISSFSDLKSHHAQDHGADVWLVAGADTLIIEGLNVADLKGAYFDI